MTQREKVLEMLGASSRPLHSSEFRAAGIASETLARMVRAQLLDWPAEAYFALPGRIGFIESDMVGFALRCPRGAVGLLTAAVHHGITQEVPPFIQAFIPRSFGGSMVIGGGATTRVEAISPRSETLLDLGVETMDIGGVPVRITSRERTLIDLFVFSPAGGVRDDRVRIPEESFMDALQRCTVDPEFSFDRMHELAREIGVDTAMEPYTKSFRYKPQADATLAM